MQRVLHSRGKNMSTSSKKISVAEYIAYFIVSLGVDTVPFVQGGAIMKVIDEVGQHPKLRYVACNHEQAVAMFVDGYARLKGFGVGLATSGPGGTNMATGIACAYYDSVPCMFITGQVGMFHVKGARRVRQRGFQETDIVSMMAPITKYAVMLEKGEDVRFIFEKAAYLAKLGRPGPVLVDVPFNVQRELVDPKALRGFVPEQKKDGTAPIDIHVVREVCAELTAAKRPVLLIGGGVRLAGEAKNAIVLADTLGIPVITSWGAAGIFPWGHPLYLGSPGRYGNISANEIALESDLILALGTRFSTKMVHTDKIFSKETKVIAVDIDEGELIDGLLSHYKTIAADVREFIPALARECKRTLARKNSEMGVWGARAQKLKAELFSINVPPPSKSHRYVNVHRFVNTLSDLLGNDDVIISDCGLNLVWSVQGYKPKGGEQRFISAWGHSPMGYSFPASIGAHYGRPRAKTVCLIGDGGMQMNIQELQTVFVNKVPVKIFVLNNRCYGMMMLNKGDFGGRTFGNEPKTGYAAPNFVKIGKAYGIPSYELANDAAVARNLKKILSVKGPALINVNLHPDQTMLDHVFAAAAKK